MNVPKLIGKYKRIDNLEHIPLSRTLCVHARFRTKMSPTVSSL